MVQRVEVQLIDDLDGKSTADDTVTFALDGVTYDIDLTNKNAAKLRDALAPFVGAGRRTGRIPGGKRGSKAQSGPSPKVIREWAKANGHDVPDRGRVPAEVVEAYTAAQAS